MDKNNEIAPRTFVVEMSVKIEHLSNVIISRLLEVNPSETRSFGTSFFALSFNAKANLLLDLNHLNKEQGHKFQIFMEVRNKFAHVYSVDTFEKCFALTKNYNQLKKLFGIYKEGENQEKDMEYMFISLSLDMAKTLKEIGDNIYRQMAVKYTQRRLTEAINKTKEYKLQKPLNAEAVDDFIDFLKVDLINEVDEIIKNNIQPHT